MRRLLLPPSVLALVAGVTLAVSSCLSPTLPLPPPEQPDTVQPGTDAGTWQVFGTCDAGAIVTVFDETTGMGVVVEDRAMTGKYVVILAGSECDSAWVRESFQDEESSPTTFVLTTYSPNDPIGSPTCQ